jgi:hypothetical protein
MSRAVPPERVTSLKDWVARWPKASNLKFDAETREATVYTTAGTKDKSFPWEREGDVLTVLSAPERFSGEMVEAAKRRYGRYRKRVEDARALAEAPMIAAERDLLEAWQAYRAAPPAARDALRSDIIEAEKAVRNLEKTLAAAVYRGREATTVEITGVYEKIVKKSGAAQLARRTEATGVYVPPFPVGRRGMAAAEALGASPSSDGFSEVPTESTAGSSEMLSGNSNAYSGSNYSE